MNKKKKRSQSKVSRTPEMPLIDEVSREETLKSNPNYDSDGTNESEDELRKEEIKCNISAKMMADNGDDDDDSDDDDNDDNNNSNNDGSTSHLSQDQYHNNLDSELPSAGISFPNHSEPESSHFERSESDVEVHKSDNYSNVKYSDAELSIHYNNFNRDSSRFLQEDQQKLHLLYKARGDEIEKLSKKLEEKGTEISEGKRDIILLKSQVKTLQEDKKSKENHLDQFESKMFSLEKRLEEAKENGVQGNKQNEKYLTKIKTLEGENTYFQNRIQELESINFNKKNREAEEEYYKKFQKAATNEKYDLKVQLQAREMDLKVAKDQIMDLKANENFAKCQCRESFFGNEAKALQHKLELLQEQHKLVHDELESYDRMNRLGLFKLLQRTGENSINLDQVRKALQYNNTNESVNESIKNSSIHSLPTDQIEMLMKELSICMVNNGKSRNMVAKLNDELANRNTDLKSFNSYFPVTLVEENIGLKKQLSDSVTELSKLIIKTKKFEGFLLAVLKKMKNTSLEKIEHDIFKVMNNYIKIYSESIIGFTMIQQEYVETITKTNAHLVARSFCINEERFQKLQTVMQRLIGEIKRNVRFSDIDNSIVEIQALINDFSGAVAKWKNENLFKLEEIIAHKTEILKLNQNLRDEKLLSEKAKGDVEILSVKLNNMQEKEEQILHPLEGLRKEVMSLKAERDKLIEEQCKERNEIESTCQQLKETLKNAIIERDDLQDNLEKLQKEAAELKMENRDIQQQKSPSDLSPEVVSFQLKVDQLQTENSNLKLENTTQVESLEIQIKALKAKLADLNQQKMEEADNFTTEIRNIKSQNANENSKDSPYIKNLSDKNLDLSIEIERLQNVIENYKVQIDSLEEQLRNHTDIEERIECLKKLSEEGEQDKEARVEFFKKELAKRDESLSVEKQVGKEVILKLKDKILAEREKTMQEVIKRNQMEDEHRVTQLKMNENYEEDVNKITDELHNKEAQMTEMQSKLECTIYSLTKANSELQIGNENYVKEIQMLLEKNAKTFNQYKERYDEIREQNAVLHKKHKDQKVKDRELRNKDLQKLKGTYDAAGLNHLEEFKHWLNHVREVTLEVVNLTIRKLKTSPKFTKLIDSYEICEDLNNIKSKLEAIVVPKRLMIF